jgi:hypothetical protein
MAGLDETPDATAEEAVASYAEQRKAVEKARAVRIFLSHLAAYVVGNIFLGSWNSLTYYIKEDHTLWFYIPLLFWGIGVIVHYLQGVALFDEWWEMDDRAIGERLAG